MTTRRKMTTTVLLLLLVICSVREYRAEWTWILLRLGRDGPMSFWWIVGILGLMFLIDLLYPQDPPGGGPWMMDD